MSERPLTSSRAIFARPSNKNQKKGLSMRLRHFAIACSLAVLSAAPALAVPITYEFAGTAAGLNPIGNYFYDFGVPYFAPISGLITLESDATPYYEDASQKNYYDMLT